MTIVELEKRIESGTSTKYIDIILGILKKIPKYWLSKVGVKKMIKTLPIFKEKLDIPD